MMDFMGEVLEERVFERMAPMIKYLAVIYRGVGMVFGGRMVDRALSRPLRVEYWTG